MVCPVLWVYNFTNYLLFPFLFVFIFVILFCSNRICGLKGLHTSPPTSSLGSCAGLKSSPSLLWVHWPTVFSHYFFPPQLSWRDFFLSKTNGLKSVRIRFACRKNLVLIIRSKYKILFSVGLKNTKTGKRSRLVVWIHSTTNYSVSLWESFNLSLI